VLHERLLGRLVGSRVDGDLGHEGLRGRGELTAEQFAGADVPRHDDEPGRRRAYGFVDRGRDLAGGLLPDLLRVGLPVRLLPPRAGLGGVQRVGAALDALFVLGSTRGSVPESVAAEPTSFATDLDHQERQVERPVCQQREQVRDRTRADGLLPVQVTGQHLAQHELVVADEHVAGDGGRDARLLDELLLDDLDRPGRSALLLQPVRHGAPLEGGHPSGVLPVAGGVDVRPRPGAGCLQRLDEVRLQGGVPAFSHQCSSRSCRRWRSPSAAFVLALSPHRPRSELTPFQGRSEHPGPNTHGHSGSVVC
jgi:hypothetical protein